MILIEHTTVSGFEAAIRGMRNPKNSWSLSDTAWNSVSGLPIIGPGDKGLMQRLRQAGPEHRKYMRFITVSCDITAPMYWWSQLDTYKVGTVRNSCSKMHKLLHKPFEARDFSFDGIVEDYKGTAAAIVDTLNELRSACLKEKDPDRKRALWDSVLKLLPDSYNQRATWLANYEVLCAIHHQRKAHKLPEWHDFCRWISELPAAEWLIVEPGEEEEGRGCRER